MEGRFGGKVRRMAVARVPTEDTSERIFRYLRIFPRQTAVLEFNNPRPRSRGDSCSPAPELRLVSSRPNTRGGLSPCLHARKASCSPWQRVRAAASLGTAETPLYRYTTNKSCKRSPRLELPSGWGEKIFRIRVNLSPNGTAVLLLDIQFLGLESSIGRK